MTLKEFHKEYHQLGYHNRIMVTVILSQMLLIAIFRFWPDMDNTQQRPVFDDVRQEVFVEEIVNTRQDAAPARPPKPQMPVPVPSDEVIEEEIDITEFEAELSLEPLGTEKVGQTGDSDQIVGSPERRPTVLKIVEPTTPEAAKQAGLRAEVYVTFLVDRTGAVEEIYIAEIRKYEGDSNRYEVVNDIGYGIIGAALEAAGQWRFKPAMDNGREVKAYTTQVFSFGF